MTTTEVQARVWNDLAARSLRGLAQTQLSLEKTRIGMHNRIDALERGEDQVEPEVWELYLRVKAALEEIELESERMLAAFVPRHPAGAWCLGVKGMGPNLSGKLLGYLLPPLPNRGPSTWYKACGLNVVENPKGEMRLPRRDNPAAFKDVEYVDRDGEVQTRRSPTWHPTLRAICHQIGKSFVRTGFTSRRTGRVSTSYYRQRYEEFRARFQELHPDWPLYRLDAVARVRTVKLFLSHLYRVWAEQESIPISDPYPIAILGHQHVLEPPEPGE